MLARRVITRGLAQARFVSTKIEEELDLKRRGAEDDYVNRKDRENLRRLLQKMEDMAVEISEHDQLADRRRARLMNILNGHNVHLPEKLIEDLMKWKNGQLN